MKSITSQLAYFFQNRGTQKNIWQLSKFMIILIIVILVYTFLFHEIMAYEGEEYGWITGMYWTLVTMSTLGFGDITFQSTLGQVFSMIVLFSGILFLLVLLPFTFIQFFYAPWLEAQTQARTPRKLPEGVNNHVIITKYDDIAQSLIGKLNKFNRPYVVLIDDLQRALELSDLGISVVLGALDDPNTYKKLRVDSAAMVVANNHDMINTNIAFTVRELSETVPIITTANSAEAVDILKLAGSNHVLNISETMGQTFGRRTLGGSARVHVIGRFDEMIISEAPAVGTPLVGKTILESRLREITGMNVVGLWERGDFELAKADSVINDKTILVLVGSVDQMRSYDELFGIYHATDAPVVIIGGGRVGRATAKSLKERQIKYKIIEKKTNLIRNTKNYVVGDAADLMTLRKAGINEAHTVIITTHDDDVNIYLTIYCRQLRPDIQITARTTLSRNLSTLHRAGADFVMSYATMGANAIFNLLKRGEVLMLAEGLDIFKTPVPNKLVGKKLYETNIREDTGCTVVALSKKGEGMEINPNPESELLPNENMVLIGTLEGEETFLKKYSNK
ncbi:MAG: NAD-binding protein [Balneolales bacterium]